MDTYFGWAHVETICDLKAIADKHNCKINFGTRHTTSDTVDCGLMEKAGFTKDEVDFILRRSDIDRMSCDFDVIWFELYDIEKHTNNTLAYVESSTLLTFSRDFEFDEDEELMRKLEENDAFWEYDEYSLDLRDSSTQIVGFGKDKREENSLVYREGMALKYFADYVCDYLKEPRIERVY